MIILILLSQYFHNKSYMASCNWFLFGLTINITFYLPLTTCHIHFIIKFVWKYCVLIFIKNNVLGFCSFVQKKKKKLISKTLAYFTADSKMKLFFPILFVFISKKLHYCYNQQISIYICDSFSFSLSLFLCSIFS